jgi:MORN repeat protein
VKTRREKDGLHRKFYPNKKLREEYSVKDGEPHGAFKKWHDNGHLKSEIPFVHGQMTGRMRIWGRDGMFITQGYYVAGRPISKKKYLELCKDNPSLPVYADEKFTNTLGNYVRRLKRERRQQAKPGPTAEQIQEQQWFDAWCKAEIRRKNSKEVFAWLSRKTRAETEFGEMSKAEALGLARKIYALGAAKIWATNIEMDPDGSQYSRHLVVSLPKDKSRREKIIALCADPARPVMGGSRPATRTGQKFMSVSLL